MRIRRLYLSSDGTQYHTRREAENHERNRMSYETEVRRSRNRAAKIQEKERIRAAKLQAKENDLRTKLTNRFGETISPAVELIIRNRSAIRRILTGTR